MLLESAASPLKNPEPDFNFLHKISPIQISMDWLVLGGSQVWRRGQRVAGQIVRNDGVYAKSQAVYDSAKYGKRMGQIADVFASGGICDGADAYK